VTRPVVKTRGKPLVRGVVLALLASVLGFGCVTKPVKKPAPELEKWSQWRAKRHFSIAGPEGWATLVALQWLKPGTNWITARGDGDVVLPVGAADGPLGSIIWEGPSFRFQSPARASVTRNGRPVRDEVLDTDKAPEPTKLEVGALKFWVIERGAKAAVRAKDPRARARLDFKGLEYYPYRSEWRLAGQFNAFPTPRRVKVLDITGNQTEETSSGTVTVMIQGRPWQLETMDDVDEGDLWVVFRDATAGKTTYPGGRFLHMAPPDAEGHVVVDFNYAYNPPCAFTRFATCPLPPPANRLPLEVTAGEKAYTGSH
jgi:uncharacterized protein